MDVAKYPAIRRVVTGHGADKVAEILIDGPATNAKFPLPGIVSTMMWCTEGSPAKIPLGDTIEDLVARNLGTAPPARGTRFAVIDSLPAIIRTCIAPKRSTMSS